MICMSVPTAWLTDRHQGVLVTLKADGSPQTSNVLFVFRDGVARVSVTDDRAKTHNLRRDPRAVLHVVGDSFWTYASVQVTADLTEVSTEAGDALGRELLELYETISGEPHPDPEEFLQAQVSERRLLLRLVPIGAVSMGLD
jgi:PPOX class probable F420-dependent enzyme